LPERVLGVVDDVHLDAEPGAQRVHERRDGAIAHPGHRAGGAVHHELRGDAGAVSAVSRDEILTAQLPGGRGGQVHGAERVPHRRGADLRPAVLGDRLDGLGELDLQAAWQIEAVLGLHDEGHAPLAGLAIDAITAS
jgi:hypothetical protein